MVTVVVEGSEQRKKKRERECTSFLYLSLLLLEEIEICSICCSIKYVWAALACGAKRNTIGTAAMNNGAEGTLDLFVILFFQKENDILPLAVAQNVIFIS